MQPLITVIVPVYKVEPYLTRCLDSLCRQSLKDIEILLIDDASPDRCGEICEQYAANDSRFRVIHHAENKGLAEARNTGIRQATATYIMFVDSDDYVHEDFCKTPYECAIKYKADLVMFRRMFIDFPNIKPLTESAIPNGYITYEKALDLMLTNLIGTAAWNKLYHKKLFHSISYPSEYWYEDAGTTYKIICQATSIYYLDAVLYFYCYHTGSISARNTEKNLKDLCEMYIRQCQDLVLWGYQSKKLEETMLNYALSYCIQKKPDPSDKYYNFCTAFLHNAKTTPAHFTWKQKILFFLLNNYPTTFEFICSLCNKKVC